MKKPYYEHNGITIYHGDCLDILPQLETVDLVFTDFIYGIGLNYSKTFKDDTEYLDFLILKALPMMRKIAPVVGLTCGIGNLSKYPEPTWVLCWYMSNACSSTGRWGFNQWQPVVVYGTDPYLKRRMGRRPDIIITAAPNSGADKTLGHPCPKPKEAWIKILNRLSPDTKDIVCDPLMGSGTTLLNCKNTGRKAIGIEIEEKYCEIAARRLSQEVFSFKEMD